MFLLYILLFYFVSVSASVIFQDCGSAYELHRVNILGCGMRLPCYITLGENVPVTMEFYSDFESRKLDQDVTLNINYVSSRTYVTPNPCATVHCPVKSDAVMSFTSLMSVPRNVPVNQRGFLQWRVYNDENRLVLCFSVLVHTDSPLNKFLRRFRMKPSDILSVGAHKVVGNYKNVTNTENIFLKYLLRHYYVNWKAK